METITVKTSKYGAPRKAGAERCACAQSTLKRAKSRNFECCRLNGCWERVKHLARPIRKKVTTSPRWNMHPKQKEFMESEESQVLFGAASEVSGLALFRYKRPRLDSIENVEKLLAADPVELEKYLNGAWGLSPCLHCNQPATFRTEGKFKICNLCQGVNQ